MEMIPTLTDDEMRVKCAELCGWTNAPCKCGCDRDWIPPGATCGVYKHQLPDYLTSLDAAITLCDVLAKDGWIVDHHKHSADGSLWACGFTNLNGVGGEATIRITATDKSLARALVLAALKTKGLAE